MLLHPHEGRPLVQQAQVALTPPHVRVREEAEGPEAVGGAHDDDVVVDRQPPPVHLVGGPLEEIPSVEVDHDCGWGIYIGYIYSVAVRTTGVRRARDPCLAHARMRICIRIRLPGRGGTTTSRSPSSPSSSAPWPSCSFSPRRSSVRPCWWPSAPAPASVDAGGAPSTRRLEPGVGAKMLRRRQSRSEPNTYSSTGEGGQGRIR